MISLTSVLNSWSTTPNSPAEHQLSSRCAPHVDTDGCSTSTRCNRTRDAISTFYARISTGAARARRGGDRLCGTGAMGQAIAHRLLESDHSVVVHNRTKTKTNAQSSPDAGGLKVKSRRGRWTVHSCGAVLSSRFDGLGPDGLWRNAMAGGGGVRLLLIEQSRHCGPTVVTS